VFGGADWRWFASPFTHAGIHVAWPLATVDLLSHPGPTTPDEASSAAAILGSAFPPA